MSREMAFFMYLTERYAEYKNTTAGNILRQWDNAGITDRVFNLYELYHTEAIENAFTDIDSLLQTE